MLAETDPRTVQRYLAGQPVRGVCGKRIERALSSYPNAPIPAPPVVPESTER